MKKKLIFILIVLAAVMGFSACNSIYTNPDHLIKQGYVKVVLDFNGGWQLNLKTSGEYYYKPNTMLAQPGKMYNNVLLIQEPVLTGYVLDGWYSSYTEVDGEKVFSEEDRWDFSTDTVPEGGLTLTAKWRRNFMFVVLFNYDSATNTYLGRKEIVVTPNADFTIEKKDMPSWSNHTLVNYYHEEVKQNLYTDQDSALTPISFPIRHKGIEGEEEEYIYTKWIQGTYTLVYNKETLEKMSPGLNYYLMNDIDFENGSWTPPVNYSGTFNGNNKSIKNLVVVDDNSNVESGAAITSFGLFRRLVGTSTLLNLTFDNCSYTALVREGFDKRIDVGFLAGEAIGTTLTNVNIINSKVILGNELTNSNVNFGAVYSNGLSITQTNCNFAGLTKIPA